MCVASRMDYERRLERLHACLQVVDALEDFMEAGGNIVDHHGCDFFPER